ncbi:D-hydantoinase [Colletotrichum eremochloae]|nr:D-hydantoinase [Colletotrichum eremochloae]
MDLIISNGRIVTASEVFPFGIQIGIKDGKIASIGLDLTKLYPSARVIDAEGGYITPGGIDSHVHVQQANAPTGDTWETATRSAVAGGTTTVLAFASQQRHEESLRPALSDYHNKAKGQAYCDYGFHLILTNVNDTVLHTDLPSMVSDEGITSVKLYMTYDRYKLSDKDLLSIMMSCRKLGMTTMIHAENADMIDVVIQGLERNKHTEPFYHSIARPRIAEDEASYRAIALAELVDAPILLVHMSSARAVRHVRDAQTRLLPIHAETCPHYLFLLSDQLQSCHAHDHFHGARNICAPPLRHHVKDLEALWQGIHNGSFTVWSSDHAPHTYDHPQGKKIGLVDGIPRFSKVPNGIPGIETRLSLLFSQTPACVPPEKARLSLPQFVQLTATNAAKLYGLDDRKGSIIIGHDADLIIWYPQESPKVPFEIKNENLHHAIDFTPFEGMEVRNWPRYTIIRGQVVWDRDGDGVIGKKGFGNFLKRNKGTLVMGKLGQMAEGMTEGERDLWM